MSVKNRLKVLRPFNKDGEPDRFFYCGAASREDCLFGNVCTRDFFNKIRECTCKEAIDDYHAQVASKMSEDLPGTDKDRVLKWVEASGNPEAVLKKKKEKPQGD